MSANTLTGLIPTLYDALDIVAREFVGAIPATTRNSSAERAALNETITFPIVPAMTSTNITPANIAPDPSGMTIGTGSLSITKSKKVSFPYTGEEQKGLGNTYPTNVGPPILTSQFAQAFRTLCNEVEADVVNAAYQGASRAYGTAGATPFGTAADLSDAAGVLRILDDNGTPQTDRHLVLGSAAIANLRGKQSVLFKVNEAGTEEMLRRGTIGLLEGLEIHNSAQVPVVTKGTGASYVTNGSTAAGVSSIALITGSGTVLAGDVVTFAADTNNKYVINTGIAAPGTIVLGTPGARVTIASANAMTIGANYTANVAFHRSAIQLVTRAPAMPTQGDQASDVTEVTDPNSGLAFQIAIYRQYRQVAFEVGLAWGVKCVKNDFVAILMG